MGFWVYMLVIVLLVPLLMIFFGSRFEKGAPEDVNAFIAYRTRRSTVNGDTWQYGHKKFGHLCKLFGLIALPVSAAIMVITVKMSPDAANILATFVIGVQFVMFFVPVILTEKDLKNSFDEIGRRTEESLLKEQEAENKKAQKKESKPAKVKKEKATK